MRNKQASQRLVQWKVVVQHIREDAASLPYLSEEVASLEQLLGEAEILVLQREAKTAEIRQLGTSLGEISRQGDRLRGRIHAILNGKLGFTDDRLLRYGFGPRRVPTRRVRKPQPEPPPVPPVLATKAEGGDSPP